MATNGIQEELEQFDAHIQGCVAASKKALFDGAAVMADAINARALDETGDILLDAGDEGPRVIEEYLPFARRLAGLAQR